MTNTHITIGGHKITTNTVGTKHNITNFKTGFSGTVAWLVRNGWCHVQMWPLILSSNVTSSIAFSGLPPIKLSAGVLIPHGSSYASAAFVYVDDTTGNLKVTGTSGNLYGHLIYPVSDDWVES